MFLILLIKSIIGVVLGLTIGRSTMSLAGGVLAGLVGETAIVSYSTCCLMSSISRDIFTIEGPITIRHIQFILNARAFAIVLGIALACFCNTIGWKGFPPQSTIIILVVVLVWRFQLAIEFWGLGFLFIAVIKGAEFAGVSNAPLAALMVIGTLNTKQNWRLKPRRLVSYDTNVGEAAIGFLVGAVPTLNARLILEDEPVIWNVNAIAEGFIMGVVIFQRNSGRTSFSTLITQFAPNLSPTIILITVGLTLWICLIPLVVKICCKPVLIPELIECLLFTGAFSWYASFAGNPIWGLGLGFIIYWGLIYQAESFEYNRHSWLPYKFNYGLASVPLIVLNLI
jgi:hypothetical protein